VTVNYGLEFFKV